MLVQGDLGRWAWLIKVKNAVRFTLRSANEGDRGRCSRCLLFTNKDVIDLYIIAACVMPEMRKSMLSQLVRLSLRLLLLRGSARVSNFRRYYSSPFYVLYFSSYTN